MRPDQYDKIIEGFKMILIYWGSLAAAVVGITTIVKERSVGAKAVKDIRDDIISIKDDIKDAKDRLEKAESKYDGFVQKILNNFPFK